MTLNAARADQTAAGIAPLEPGLPFARSNIDSCLNSIDNIDNSQYCAGDRSYALLRFVHSPVQTVPCDRVVTDKG
jgi:hypothetical protein